MVHFHPVFKSMIIINKPELVLNYEPTDIDFVYLWIETVDSHSVFQSKTRID